MAELIQCPLNGGHRAEYRKRKDWYEPYVGKELGDQAVTASYWVLMTRHILPGSRNENQALIVQQAERTHLPYTMPKAIEAATSILTHFVRTKERLYHFSDKEGPIPVLEPQKDPLLATYTRCREKVDNNQWPVFVGGFFSGGLAIGHNRYVDFGGIGCVIDPFVL